MEIKFLPFYYKSHLTNDNGGLPHIMPFELFFDDELKLLRQKPSSIITDILKQVYLEGSLVDGSVSSESGFHYIEPITNYILEHGKINKDSKILEIGFGEGGFLSELKKKNFIHLTGIEPGNHKRCEGLEGVNLISDFYPSMKYSEKVDLIYHCLVLEHIDDPLAFLHAQKLQLSEDGRIIFFVPNEEPFIQSGDCSSFIHEHFNFFTTQSIVSIITKLGMFVQDISIIQGLIAVTIGFSQVNIEFINENEKFDFQVYLKQISQNIEKISRFMSHFDLQSDVALYVPSRALNSMFLSGVQNTRLVDDSTEVHNKFLPYFSNSIESFQSIIANPPKAILIFSRTFGQKIKEKCESCPELQKTQIYNLEDLLNV